MTFAPFDCIISNREARTGRAEAEEIEENRNMKTYVALTTTNYQTNGYHEVARGGDKESVRAEAETKIVGE